MKQGDTIDFVVDCRESTDADAFEWIVELRLAAADGQRTGPLEFGPSILPVRPLPRWRGQVAYAWQLAFGGRSRPRSFRWSSRFLRAADRRPGPRLHADPGRGRWPISPSSCSAPTSFCMSIEDGPEEGEPHQPADRCTSGRSTGIGLAGRFYRGRVAADVSVAQRASAWVAWHWPACWTKKGCWPTRRPSRSIRTLSISGRGSPTSPPQAKAMISLFMHGGPSHVDLLDPKPELTRLDGTEYEARSNSVS